MTHLTEFARVSVLRQAEVHPIRRWIWPSLLCWLGLSFCQPAMARQAAQQTTQPLEDTKSLSEDVASVKQDLQTLDKDLKALDKDLKDIKKKDVQTVGDQQQQILDQLADLKKLIQTSAVAGRPPAPALQLPPTMDVHGDPAEGASTAQVAIVEFTDFQCPYCGSFAKQTYPQLVDNYIKPGKVKLIYRDLPLTFHPHAMPAALAARCAGEQGKFWEMHDSLFADQQDLESKDFVDRASKLGLDSGKFNQCIASDKYKNDIQSNIDYAEKLGIHGTPAFVIGTVGPDGNLKVTKGFVGARPYEVFKTDLDEVLAKQ